MVTAVTDVCARCGHPRGEHMRLGCAVGWPPRRPPMCQCETFVDAD